MTTPQQESKAAIRDTLNLKNLRRHDSTISEIVQTTSYATLYEHEGVEWLKSNVEGPMFLFSRTISPTYGFCILNRNGLEYVQELLQPDSEVRMEGDFILFEPTADAERATGIWVFEEKERLTLFTKMNELRLAA